jgi:integrase/recombinase XerD
MIPLSDAISQFMLHCKYSKNLSPLTLRAYTIDLNQFVQKCQPTSPIHSITKSDIRAYVKTLFEAKLKETSIRRKIATLKALFNFLEYDEKITSNPVRQLGIQLRMPKRVPRSISLPNVSQLLYHAQQLNRALTQNSRGRTRSRLSGKIYSNARQVAILELLFSTGMRVGELSKLNIEDVDLSKGIVRVFGKGSRERTIALTHREVINSIKSYLALRKARPCNTPSFLVNRLRRRMQPHSIRTVVVNSGKASQLPMKITPHMLRHTTATLMLENGIDIRFVQRLLGHSSISTTQWYTHTSSNAERKVLENLHPRNLF